MSIPLNLLGVSGVIAAITIAANPGTQSQAPSNPASNAGWETAIKFVQKWEGDGAASSVDLGGRTRFGVTQSLWTGLGVPEPQTKEDAAKIFMRIYWDGGPRCSQYVAPLNAVCFDTAVNFGPKGDGNRTHGWASLSAGVNLTDAIAASREIIKRRKAWRHTMVARKPEQKVHLQGWLNRDNNLEKTFLGAAR